MSKPPSDVWVQVVQQDGTKIGDIFKIKPRPDDISDFRETVKEKKATKLAHCDADELKVFPHDADLNGDPLGATEAVPLGSGTAPVLVVAPSVEKPAGDRRASGRQHARQLAELFDVKVDSKTQDTNQMLRLICTALALKEKDRGLVVDEVQRDLEFIDLLVWQFHDMHLASGLVLLGTPPSGAKCLDFGSNVTARSFALTVEPLRVFEVWQLLRLDHQLEADTFLSIYSVFGGFPSLLQELMAYPKLKHIISPTQKNDLAEFLFKEVQGFLDIPCETVLRELGRHGKKMSDLNKLPAERHKEIQQLIARGILKLVQSLPDILSGSSEFNYLQISDTLLVQTVASANMQSVTPVTRLNRLRGFGLEYALADIARYQLQTGNKTVFGLPERSWEVLDSWCGDATDFDLLLVEQEMDEEEKVCSLFDDVSVFDDEVFEEKTEKRALVAATLKVRSEALLDKKHIATFVQAVSPFCEQFEVTIALGCLAIPSKVFTKQLLSAWGDACMPTRGLSLSPIIICLASELEASPKLQVLRDSFGRPRVDRCLLKNQFVESVQNHKIVRIQGHRQVGKTSLVRENTNGFEYFVLG